MTTSIIKQSLAAVAAMCLLLTTAWAEGRPQNGVGEVSLLLGKAYIQSAGQAGSGGSGREARKAVEVGTIIHPGDQVITAANGHVHIRFIDNALASVRPNSRLEVTDYTFNAARPELSTVKFNLVEGVARSISGEAGQSARERFRLDTPIAAIGVRGTDFVVSASQRHVRALVNEGAIVVAPYSDVCIAGALGPCELGAVELAGSSMQIVELAQGDLLPVLRERPEQALHELLDNDIDELGGDEETAVAKESMSDVYQESVTMRKVTRQALAGSAARVTPASLPDEELGRRQLVWGRWARGQEEQAGISVAYASARNGRDVTVSNERYGLFRVENGDKRVEADRGEVGFELDAAQAFHHSSAGVEAMIVNGGDLRIDFVQNNFATSLNLESAASGRVDFTSSGRLFSGGYFHNRSADKNIAGAVSLDGQEAGYFFDQLIESGQIRGITLWGASE